MRYWDSPPWNERARADRFIAMCGKMADEGTGARVAIDRAADGAFDTLDLNRVQAEADTRNGASARVLEKVGFVREGTLREDCVVNGEVSDSWVFGLIRREWLPSVIPTRAR
jgi:L-amino acid N-acyltransferase YncA